MGGFLHGTSLFLGANPVAHPFSELGGNVCWHAAIADLTLDFSIPTKFKFPSFQNLRMLHGIDSQWPVGCHRLEFAHFAQGVLKDKMYILFPSHVYGGCSFR